LLHRLFSYRNVIFLCALILIRFSSATEQRGAQFLEALRKKKNLPGLMLASSSDKEFSADVLVTGSTPQPGGKSRPLNPDDLLEVGSETKSFTDVLVLRRVEAGALTLNSTLGELLPNEKINSNFKNVTLSMLMTHRGGFPNETPLSAIPYKGQNRVELVRQILENPPETKVGKQVYSTYGLVGIGGILEILEGKSWEQLLNEEILKPLELNSCKFLSYPEQRTNAEKSVFPVLLNSDFATLAWGHVGNNSFSPLNPSSNKTFYSPLWNPGAGLFCNIKDQLKFMHFMASGYVGNKNPSILARDSSYKDLFTVPDGSQWKYSNGGWSLNDYSSKTHEFSSAWAYGANGGSYVMTAWIPKESRIITAYSNAWSSAGDAHWLEEAVEGIQKILR
jgi:CubicO group peptidase (beta-lactamase class C family)